MSLSCNFGKIDTHVPKSAAVRVNKGVFIKKKLCTDMWLGLRFVRVTQLIYKFKRNLPAHVHVVNDGINVDSIGNCFFFVTVSTPYFGDFGNFLLHAMCVVKIFLFN